MTPVEGANFDLMNLRDDALNLSRIAKQSYQPDTKSIHYRTFTNQDIQLRAVPIPHSFQ